MTKKLARFTKGAEKPEPGKWQLPRPGRMQYDRPVAPATTTGAACSVLSEKRKGGPRKACPIQLIFRDGEPFFRLCSADKQPGKLVRAPWDGVAAQELAEQLCLSWRQHRKTWGGVQDHVGLGRVQRRRR